MVWRGREMERLGVVGVVVLGVRERSADGWVGDMTRLGERTSN